MMKKVLFLLSFLVIFVVSCGDSGSKSVEKENETQSDPADSADTAEETEQPDSGDTAEPAEQTDSDNDPAPEESPEKPDSDESPEENSDDPQQNEEPAAAKFCQYACTKASDCLTVTSNAIYDEDNYKCENGKCIYLGCLSDAECDEVYGNVTAYTGRVYRCNKNGAYGYPECTPTCSDVADCNLYGDGSTQYANDLDNNKCENGLCVFTGCLSDAECEASMYPSGYKCLPQEYSGKTLKICTPACQTDTDCPQSGLYECKDSNCVMKSCESDEWCRKYDEKYSCF